MVVSVRPSKLASDDSVARPCGPLCKRFATIVLKLVALLCSKDRVVKRVKSAAPTVAFGQNLRRPHVRSVVGLPHAEPAAQDYAQPPNYPTLTLPPRAVCIYR